jgi:hypothetical protein
VFNIDIETCRECGGAVRIMPKALAALAGQAFAVTSQALTTAGDKQPWLNLFSRTYLKIKNHGQQALNAHLEISVFLEKFCLRHP